MVRKVRRIHWKRENSRNKKNDSEGALEKTLRLMECSLVFKVHFWYRFTPKTVNVVAVVPEEEQDYFRKEYDFLFTLNTSEWIGVDRAEITRHIRNMIFSLLPVESRRIGESE